MSGEARSRGFRALAASTGSNGGKRELARFTGPNMAERGILGEVARGNDGTTVTGPSCQCLPRLPCLVRIPIGAVTPIWNGDLRGAVPCVTSDQQGLVIAGHDDGAVAGGVAGDGPVGNSHPADCRQGLAGSRGFEAVRMRPRVRGVARRPARGEAVRPSRRRHASGRFPAAGA